MARFCTRERAMKVMLTDKFCERAKPGEWFDEKATGLALLAGKKRKTWYLHFTQNGERGRENLGHYPSMSLAEARRMVVEGKDSLEDTGELPAKPGVVTFEVAVDDFIELYAKPRQRTWDETQRVLKSGCKPWLKRGITTITPAEAYKLLEGYVADGHPSKAAVLQRWLKTFWRWAYRRGTAPENMMDRVEVETEKRDRERVFTAEEIAATWKAAADLGDDEGEAYTKLTILLAPRKTALALLTADDLEPGLWTVPFELTKSRKKSTKKRVYLVPLPPLAERIIPLFGPGRVFPSLPIYRKKSGRQVFDGKDLKAALVEHGAPADFTFHGWRHTIATWLEDEGHSEWERGLVLNHSGSGSVTAGYSHGYPLELKRTLLAKWADHVEGIVNG
jgi:integrase